ncbi:MAG: hypothetical protein PVG15_07680, partial [Desulfobacterales bacterium]
CCGCSYSFYPLIFAKGKAGEVYRLCDILSRGTGVMEYWGVAKNSMHLNITPLLNYSDTPKNLKYQAC